MARKRPPQQSRAKRTREDLLQAARIVFAQQGYLQSTIEDITREAGVSKGAYYFHFSSKEGILAALVEQWADEVEQSALDLAKDEQPAPASLRPAIEKLLFSRGSAWSPRLLLEFQSQAEQQERVGKALLKAQRTLRSAIARFIARARRAGIADETLSPDATAIALLAVRDGLIMQACLPGSGKEIDIRTATKAALAILRPETSLRRAG